ncbi:MAG TPA: hypothetical protein VNO52_13550 [Methylomirabilota bacterium]|nr:hypothetical protein [Methylomirabilota bacterium]
MVGSLSPSEEAQLAQTIEMFEVITQSQPQDYQSLEILKEAYIKLGRDHDVVRTSKRIAQAYVLMGQLSSAILEYESVLQRTPDDAEVLAALGEIESRATNLNTPAPSPEPLPEPRPPAKTSRSGKAVKPPSEVEDGRAAMFKLFVEGKVIQAGDFELCWPKTDLQSCPLAVQEPFIQILADKGIVPVEKSLRLLADKTRLGYLPMEKYDLDVELARSAPVDTLLRWCVLPFDRMSKSLLVATANPFNRQAALEIEEALHLRVLWYLTPPSDLVKILRKVVRQPLA